MLDSIHQRRHERFSASIAVRISTIEPERDPWTGHSFFRASKETCANLSRGGAFIQTDEPLDPGQKILLELNLPGGRRIDAIGRVAWTKRALAGRKKDTEESECGVGVEFLGSTAEEFTALEEFISRQ